MLSKNSKIAKLLILMHLFTMAMLTGVLLTTIMNPGLIFPHHDKIKQTHLQRKYELLIAKDQALTVREKQLYIHIDKVHDHLVELMTVKIPYLENIILLLFLIITSMSLIFIRQHQKYQIEIDNLKGA